MRNDFAASCLALFAALTSISQAANTQYAWNGHTKMRLLGQAFDSNSIFHDLTGASAWDGEGDLRLNFSARDRGWSFKADYQLFALYGDRVEYSRDLAMGTGLPFERFPGDDRRLFDLTHTLSDSGKFASLHRLDRLSIGYSTDSTVLRAGRQALTWGNGVFFSPLDIVNPFDPATIDAEYKAGDDMLYAQHLRKNGDDLQAAWVVRRNPISGDVESAASTSALKYHRVAGDNEFDFLIARSYETTIIGIGGNRSMGGAVWRADLILTEDTDWTVELVTNLTYSWTWSGKNISGAVEYYFNGFGQSDSRHDLQSLGQNPELLARLARRQTFSIGRHYLAAGMTIELSPLWLITPNVFMNLSDQSVLLQWVTQHNLGDNLTFLGALNIPIGPSGTEYGGIEAGMPDQFVSQSAGLFMQLAWYF
jgi:hypothetical protein